MFPQSKSKAKKNPVKGLLRTILIAFIFVSAFPPRASYSRNDNKIIFAINLPPSFLGQGAADIINHFNKLKKGVAQKTGYDFTVQTFSSWEQVISALKKGNADVAWLPAYYFARFRATDKTGGIAPLVTLSMYGANKSRACLYVRRDSGKRNLDAFTVSRVAFPDQSSWILLNLIFENLKYPISPFYFFDSHEELTRESAAYALHFKEVDAIVLEESYIAFVETSIKGFRKEIFPLACAQPLTNTLIVYSASMGAGKLSRMKSLLLNMHKDPAMGEARRLLKMSGGQWMETRAGYYADWINLYSKAVRKGWIKDYYKLGLKRGEGNE